MRMALFLMYIYKLGTGEENKKIWQIGVFEAYFSKGSHGFALYIRISFISSLVPLFPITSGQRKLHQVRHYLLEYE